MTLNSLRRRSPEFLLFLSLILISGVTSRAQTRGGITGTVSDPNGAVIPGVTVTVMCECSSTDCKGLSCPECCPAISVTTDDSGGFRIGSLPAGNYSLEAVLTGFGKARVSVTVSTGHSTTVNVQISPGISEVTTLLNASSAMKSSSAATCASAPISSAPPRKSAKTSLSAKQSPSSTFSKSKGQDQAYLIKEIRQELVDLPNYGVFDWLDYEVQGDGTIVLRGQVVDAATKSDAEVRVKSIDRVSRIVNKIEVLPSSREDQQMRVDLYRSLYDTNSPLFRYATRGRLPIHIIVNNRSTTLRGTVDSKADAQLVYLRASSVRGVSGLKVELCECDDVECRGKTCSECCPILRAR